MEKRLYKATIEGNTESLVKLIQQDALILDRSTSTTAHLETPLHIAAMLGYEQFAIELLKLKPGLDHHSIWHHSKAMDGKNPLHVAAMMGRIDALKESVRVRPDAAHALVNRGETILHLCVQYCQFETLKLLLETVDFHDLINSKDKNGNTILHLAVADKQVETTDFLLSVAAIEVNALNFSGMTAIDILIQRKRDMRDMEMEHSLRRAGASVVREENTPPVFAHHDMPNRSLFQQPVCICSHTNLPKYAWKNSLKHQDDWLERKRSALMVVASLIATMAFQVGISPPEKALAENSNTADLGNSPHGSHDAQYYLTIIYTYLKKHPRFYMVNTTSFIASLSIIFLLMSGLPIKGRAFMWILMVMTWIAITAIALTYAVSVILLTPSAQEDSTRNVLGITVFIWICQITLLLLGHTLRLIVKMMKVVIRPFRVRRKLSDSSLL
ncbi:UNVERIFIED_CONTAM: hypothetical protein Sradi_1081100 [Sesamum radiatum]|uniref:PGG domain-containing protein n=2 Tax=Sesamum TaxID=4181 RepID=A0AAW2V916_SESRA